MRYGHCEGGYKALSLLREAAVFAGYELGYFISLYDIAAPSPKGLREVSASVLDTDRREQSDARYYDMQSPRNRARVSKQHISRQRGAHDAQV